MTVYGRILSLAVCALPLLTGCASTGHDDVGTHRVQDSVTQTVSEAPAKLSPPTDGNAVDPTYMRSQADFHFAMGDALSMEGNAQRAIEEFKLALLYDNNSASIRLRLAAEYVRRGLINEAMEQTQAAVKADPKRVDGHMLLGGLYSAIKSYDKARHEYSQVIKLDPENTDAPVFLGALLAEQKYYDEAIAQFQKLADMESNKNPHMAYYYMGRLFHDLEGKDTQSKAEKAYRQSIKLKPSFAEASLALGDLLLKHERRAEAIKLYRGFQEKFGPNAQVAEQLGRLYMEDEDYDNAYRQFELQEASDEENLNIKVKMALILVEKRRYSEAVVKLEDILGKAPNSDKIRFYLGAVYEELQKYSLAIGHFNQIPADSSFYAEAVVHSAYLHKMEKRYPEAITTIRKGISVKPDVPQFYALYASFLEDTKDYPKAVSMLEDAVQKFPDNTQLHFFLGSMYDRVRDYAGTVREMKRVLELESEHVQALNYLAFTYADHNAELEEAERLARKALEFQPNDGYIMDTLGWVLFKQGKTAEAVKVLEIAHRSQPSESIIADHLGDAYMKSDLPEKAKYMYQRAVETETDAVTIRKLQEKIASVDAQKSPVAANQEERKPAALGK